jgi:hypothetical protein
LRGTGAGGGGVTITVVLSPGFPGSPLAPSITELPGVPCGPAGPGTTTVVGAGAGAGAGVGTVTTVGLSQADRVIAANSAETSIEYFMVNPLTVKNQGAEIGRDLRTHRKSVALFDETRPLTNAVQCVGVQRVKSFFVMAQIVKLT